MAPNIVAPAPTPAAPPVIALRQAPVAAVTPAGEDIAVAQVVEPPPVQIAAVQTAPEGQTRVLPKTANSLNEMTLASPAVVNDSLILRTATKLYRIPTAPLRNPRAEESRRG